LKTGKSSHQLNDEDLVFKIIKTNDTLLFEELYDRYAQIVFNKCLGFSRDSQEAQDLSQDIFLNLFVKLSSYKGKSKFSTWLYAFTYNYCVNYVNRNTAKKIEKKSVDESHIVNISDSELDEDFNNIKVEYLFQALNMINADDKMIILLKYQDDLSIKDISQVLELAESAVKMRIKRAKEKLVNVYKNNFLDG
jgi:RNA polymerase sigma factor (sigma-70 family)